MTSIAALKPHNDRLLRAADWLAVAVAVSLPWSTSATSILVVLWLLALLPTLELAALRQAITTPAGGLPILLVALGVIGMLWANVSWAIAFAGLYPFAKLVAVPLLLIHFSRSDAALRVFTGFLISCTALLALSWTIDTWPGLAWNSVKTRGVPVKDYIAQSGEFVICAFALAYVALDQYKAERRVTAAAFLMLATAFLSNIYYVATSRTALATIPILLILLGLRQFRWKGLVGIAVVGIVLATVVWASSPYLRERVTEVGNEIEAYQTERKATSAGERLDFWRKSFGFITEAPLIGHGTGSIKHMFEKATAAETGWWARASANPHNQVLAIGIQLGLLGVMVLLAMWASHLLLFRQQGLIAWIGFGLVVQNVVSSLFNSHLFDFTQGWMYVFGVGVAGGVMLRGKAEARQELAPVELSGGDIQGLNRVASGAQAQRPV